MEENKNQARGEFIDDFIRVGELRKMLEHLRDDAFITVYQREPSQAGYHKILYVEDSTAIGFWEIRI